MSKLNVIVPYRNRKEHLNIFVDTMYRFLDNSKVDSFEIYIVEQSDTKEFNRGCLLNIGFLETDAQSENYYCFSDIDTLPGSPRADYQKPPNNTIVHPYGHWHSLSNFILIDYDTYKTMNGFSTRYWEWGYEDNDFMLRAKLNKVKILRNNFTERFKSDIYYELDVHDANDMRQKMSKLSTKINELIFYNTVLNPKKRDHRRIKHH